MKVLWLASNNINKINEFKSIISKTFNNKMIIKSLKDLPENIDIKENGKTIEENSLIKAKYLAKKLNEITIADDSGLEIEDLNNFPGVKSKRWAYPIVDFKKINELVIEKCKILKNRNAQFKTVITYYDPINKIQKQFTGILKGKITNNPKGKNGFGYDPIFQLDNNKTLAELSADQKNKISHRAIAFDSLLKYLISKNI